MRILDLPAYFYPEPISSSNLDFDLHKAIVDAGMQIELYAAMPCRGVSDKVRQEYRKRKIENMYDGRMIVHRYSLYKEGKNPLFRALRYFIQSVKQFDRGVFARGARKCDVLFVASTPPIKGAMAALIKKVRHIPIVYNLQDIFPDSLVGTGLAKKDGLLWKIGRVIENFTYRNADKIIVISEDFKKNIMAKGVPEEKIEVVYNWVDESTIKPVAKKDNPLYEEFGLSREMFTLVYAGNLGNAQNISIILDGAKALPDVQFAVFGTGGLENEVRARIEKEGLTNVHLNPLQPYDRVSLVYSLGDACIVSCKEGLGGSAMPSKTWTIMSCGRPVIASFDEGELKEILENNNCGVFTHAGSVQEFTEGIMSLSSNAARCAEMGENARRFIIDNLTKEVGTKKYIEVLKSFDKK